MSKSTISTFQLFEMFPAAEAARVYMETQTMKHDPDYGHHGSLFAWPDWVMRMIGRRKEPEPAGWTSYPEVAFTGGGGTGTVPTVIVTDGVVTGVDMTGGEALAVRSSWGKSKHVLAWHDPAGGFDPDPYEWHSVSELLGR